MSESILQSLLTSTTKFTTTQTENALELLKYHQSQLEKKLLQQELINANLYQSLIDSGYITHRTASSSTVSSNLNILDMLKGKNGLKTSSSLTNSDSSSSLNGLSSMLPLNDVFTGLTNVFEKFFGTKMWIYVLLAIVIASFLIFIFCFCMYCCCCSKIGRNLMCCWKCTSFGSLFKSKKKKKSANGNDDKRFSCCI